MTINSDIFKKSICLLVLVLIALTPAEINVGDTRVKLVNNGYEGIVVAIGNGKENTLDIIETIKVRYIEIN